MIMSNIIQYLRSNKINDHFDHSGYYIVNSWRLGIITLYGIGQILQSIGDEFQYKKTLPLLIQAVIIIIILIVFCLRKKLNNEPYNYLSDLLLNTFISMALFYSKINSEAQNSILVLGIMYMSQTAIFRIISIIQLMIYLSFQQYSVIEHLNINYLLFVLGIHFVIKSYHDSTFSSQIKQFESKIDYYQKILSLLEQDRDIGVLIQWIYFQNSCADRSVTISQDESNIRFLPVTVHRYEQMGSPLIQKCSGKEVYENIGQLIEHFHRFSKQQCKIIAKNKKVELKYKIIIKDFVHDNKVYYLAFYQNIFNEVKLESAKQQMLSANYTHKLKTPLNSAINHLEFATKDERISELAKQTYIYPSLYNCQMEFYQVLDLLDYIGNTFSNIQLQQQKVNIIQVVKEVGKIIQLQCESKQIEFLFTVNDDQQPSEPILLFSDELKLKRILVNLLNNAYRYTGQGGSISINITTINNINLSNNDLQSYLFTIEDSGYGMPEEKFDQISRNLSSASRKLSQSINIFGGLSLEITNILIKLLNNSGTPLRLVKSDQFGTTFEFIIDNIVDEMKYQKFTSIANIDNYKSHRSISFSQAPQTSLMKNRGISIFGNQTKDSRKTSILKDVDEVISDEPSCQPILNINVSKSGKKTSRNKSYVHMSGQSSQKSVLLQQLESANKINYQTSTTYFGNIDRFQSSQQVHYHKQYTDKQNKASFNHLPSLTEQKEQLYIIIVDDEPFNHDSLSLLLRKICKEGLVSAFNGQECIDKVFKYNGQIKAVIMDIDMPIMDGIQATQIITKYQKDNLLDMFPIIGCTAHSDQETLDKCWEVGMLGLITKPVLTKQLNDIFHQLDFQGVSSNQF